MLVQRALMVENCSGAKRVDVRTVLVLNVLMVESCAVVENCAAAKYVDDGELCWCNVQQFWKLLWCKVCYGATCGDGATYGDGAMK